MSAWWRILSFAMLMAYAQGCPSTPTCRDGGCATAFDASDAKADAIESETALDAQSVVDVAADRGPPLPPWADGRWRIPWTPRPIPLPPACGPGTPTRGLTFFGSGSGLCVRDRWVSTLTNGGASVFDDTNIQHFALLGGPAIAFSPSCASRGGLLVGATDRRGGHAALLRFEDPREEGTVLWTRDFRASGEVVLAVNRILATTQMTVVEWRGDGGSSLLLGGPDGTSLTPDTELNRAVNGRFIEEMQADGNHMVMEVAGDIYLYTRNSDGTSTMENLTPLPSVQIDPWVSGHYVVWLDQRHGTRGTTWSYDNLEVYLYDIDTRTERRITNDPPERPVIQHYARIEGDWIVWVDQGISDHPNSYPVPSNVPLWVEVYGHHLPTGRTLPLVPGRNLLGAIALQRGELWYNCYTTEPRGNNVYRMPMPTAP